MMTLDKLMKQLGYTFNDPSLLATALRHRSMGKHNNERLEFLGDSVVNCVIAIALYQRFPEVAEGLLSRMRAELVNRSFLAKLAGEFSIGEVLTLGSGELKSGGFRRDSILADALEAIIGAILLDSDFKTVEQCLLLWFEPALADLNPEALYKDGKTALQEWLQAKGMALPSYEVTTIEGQDHDQTFSVICTIEGIDHQTKGEGRSRREAEQEAASSFLAWLQDENE